MRQSLRFVRSIVVPVFIALTCAAPAMAQVVFDSASNAAAASTGTANPITVVWNHTVGSAKKPYIVVSVAIKENGGTPTVSSVYYGTETGGPGTTGPGPNGSGVLMTLLGTSTNGTTTRAELWGLAGPTQGTHQITVTVANGGANNLAVVAGARSFFNVFQSAASGTAKANTGTSLTPTVTPIVNSAFDYVVDAVAYNNNVALTAGAGQTNSFNVVSGAPTFSGGGSIKTGVANTSTTWTATGVAAAWAAVAIPLQSASPQILFDAVSSSAGTTSAANPVVVNWNHTTTTAANRYVVVGIAIHLGGGTVPTNVNVTGVTYGGTAMTFLAGQSRTTNVRVELWGLANPNSGTNAISVSVLNSGARTLVVTAGAQTFSNVDQNAPTGAAVGANGSSAILSVAVTNSAYDYVVDIAGFNTNQTMTPGLQQDSRWNTVTAGTPFSGASSGLRGYTNATMQWAPAAGSTNWAIEAIPLKAVSVAVTKTASADVIKLGDTITYSLSATNYSSASATTVSISDAIPSGATFVSQTGCSGTGPVTCTVGTLAAGATSATFTITVVANAAGTISNVASVSYNGLAKTNFSETVKTLAEAKICANPGKDGAGGTLAGIKNDYWPGSSSPAAGATTLTVGARTTGGGVPGNNITAGDLLIVMQMQDAAFDTTNDETYGEGTGSTRATGTGSGAATSLNNAGRWEYVVATNTITGAGGALTFSGGGAGGGLLYSYTNQSFGATTTQGQRTYQIIRVPQYTIATLGSTLTALPWNGATGGILAIDVSGTLTLGSATVSVNGEGFRGGGGIKLASNVASTANDVNTDFRTLAPDSATAPMINTANGSKGEGIAGTPRYVYQHGATIGTPTSGNGPLDTTAEGYSGGSFGRGAPGNAGGGSTDGNPAGDNGDNSGGGGGGNSGSGGAGGNSWRSNVASGGQGGGGISPSLTRITMGGGGGAGTTNNASAETCNAPPTCRVNVPGDWTDTETGANGYYSSGANGGGTIIIRAMQATGTATLTANGFTAYNTGRDGSGGGGAGGSVLFTTQIGTLSGLTIQAKGGNGGNAWLTTAPGAAPTERHGPGGGGGGGYILLSSAAASTDVSAGSNGVTDTTNDSYGAQPGTVGFVQLIAGNNVLPGGDGASCVIADLAVTNVVSSPVVQPGANVTFTQTVTNNGPNAADGVVYMAPIPASSTFVSMSVPAGWTCITPAVGGTGVVICTTPTLANAATANFSLIVAAFPGGTPSGYLITETNSVSSNTPDSNPANNQATAMTIVEPTPQSSDNFADMAVTIAQDTNVPVPGGTINYSETVANLGSFTANSPSYSFTIPANTTFQSMGSPPAGWTCITPPVNGTGTITCSAASLASGTTLTWPNIAVKVNAGATPGTTVITATPSVTSTSRDPYLPNNTASVSATVVAAGSGDVGVTISNSPDPVSPAENYTYTVVATNNGPAAAANVSVSVPLPAGTNFQSLSVPAGWSCGTPAVGAGGTITCTIASLAAGASATFSPVVQVNAGTAAGTTLTCMSSITTTSTDSISSNNTATTTNLVVARTNADVGIVKTDSPDPVGVGQFVTYRLTVTNNGPAVATNVTVSDPLPGTVSLVSANPSIGSCSGTTTITCSLGTLPVGNSQFVNIVVIANSTGTLTNTATVTRTEVDPVSSNDSSTATTTVLAVTLVRLRDFTVTQDHKNVQIAWQTSFESDNLGFNVYRDIGGTQTRINKHLIAGTALSSKKHDSVAGNVYRYNDKNEDGSFTQYWLEDVDTAGHRTMHGPVSAVSGTITAPANTAPLTGLGADGEVFASPDGFGAAHALDQEPASPAQYKQQLTLAADNGLKIYVNKEGWYRLTRSAMAAAGYDPGSDPRAISLYMLGNEQFIKVDDGGDGKFDPNDAIEFYGYPLDSISTGARTYWLRSAKGNGGNRMSVSTVNGGDPITGSVPFTFERIERSIFAPLVTSDSDPFFGTLITSDGGTEPVTVAANVDASYGGNATLDLVIQGATDGTHNIDVALNGHSLGTVSLTRVDLKTFTFSVPQSWLTVGTNGVTLTSEGGWEDVSVVAKSRLTYQHLLRADNGALDVNLAGGRSVTIGGFGSNSVRAFDVTDAQHPTELQTSVAVDPNGGYAATFTTLSGTVRTVMAFDSSRLLTPGEVAVSTPSSWSDTNGNSNGSKGPGDFYIVSNSAFISAAGALKSVRDKEGTDTRIVNVDDLYDEFNFGIRSPEAIRSFFQLTTTWKHAPSAFMLLGDASVDPRNYSGLGTFDYVPTKLVPTALLKTASDDWFTDFNNDGIADVPIGRIPVRTVDEATLVIGKIASRGTPSGSWSRNALFVSDVPGDYDFPGVATSLAQLLPSTMTSQMINFATSPNAHSDVVNAMNSGNLLTTYVGHASVEIWAENVFSSTDASALTNGSRLPVVLAMNCLNGFFHDVLTESLAEALLKSQNGGAVAVWASSALTQPDQQAIMAREVFRQIFSSSNLTLGQAVTRAKYVATDPDVRKSWIFFGDPTMKLRP